MARHLILVILIGFLFSCTDQYCYEKGATFVNGWAFNEPLMITATSSEIDCPASSAAIVLSHNDDYPFENIYLRFTITIDGQEPRQQVISFPLQDDLGTWLGDARGASFEILLDLPSSVYPSDSEAFMLKVEQYTREDILQGVQGVKWVVR